MHVSLNVDGANPFFCVLPFNNGNHQRKRRRASSSNEADQWSGNAMSHYPHLLVVLFEKASDVSHNDNLRARCAWTKRHNVIFSFGFSVFHTRSKATERASSTMEEVWNAYERFMLSHSKKEKNTLRDNDTREQRASSKSQLRQDSLKPTNLFRKWAIKE